MKSLNTTEQQIAKKYSGMIEQAFESKLGKAKEAKKSQQAAQPAPAMPITSSNYSDFKKESLPRHLSFYEKLCDAAEHLVKIRPDKKKSAELQEYITMCHMESTPTGAMSLAVIAALLVTALGVVLGFLIVSSTIVVAYALGMGVFTFAALIKAQEFFANNFRLTASNQMVQCIFYVATFMRHTSNLELAVRFSADRLSPPLALDIKKILWDIETEKYGTIKESLDRYLETWRKWNMEFIEAFHLIEGSLYEPSEGRRLNMIDKALDVMLQETYDKMLHYSHDLKSPVTMLYMLGIVLPVLGLVILPMAASFLTSDTPPMKIALNIALLYNLILPLVLFYMSKMVLSKRPTGYGENDISEYNLGLRGLRNLTVRVGGRQLVINPVWLTIGVASFFVLIGLTPLLLGAVIPDEALLQERIFDQTLNFKLLDYRSVDGSLVGPYGLGAK